MSHKHNDGGNESKKLGAPAPDGPQFRSMAMTKPDPLMAFRHDDAYVRKGVGAVTPDYRVDEPSKTIYHQEPPKPDSWDEPTLTPIGLYYPLGPCQKRLARSQLGHVLDTLRRVFCTLSLHTKYHDSPISAECRSIDQVTLEVLIFAARDESDEIIVEISRQDGECYSYHLYAQQILSSISGSPSAAQPIIRVSWNLDTLNQADSVGQNNESIDEALEIAWSMLCSERYDARRLAFESLMHMTDPNKSGWSTSKATAECLLRPDGAIQERLSRHLLEYASKDVGSVGVETSSFGEDDSSFESAAEADFAYQGLVILSHTLQVAACAKTLDVKSFLDVCSTDLVGCIVEKVSDVQRRPHHAYYAVQSLAALCDCVPSIRSRIKGADIEEAQLVGESSHLALKTVTDKLLVSLQA